MTRVLLGQHRYEARQDIEIARQARTALAGG
jgi:hypothetical protein